MFFEIEKTTGRARAGYINTEHKVVPIPVFMPVGTQAAVKTLSPDDLRMTGAKLILGNAYHLYLRPGIEVVKSAGGLHKFMNWERAILTDSGGFQLFSLAELNKISDEGVLFQSHLDGSYHFFTPEKVIEIEMALGADIIMCLDVCTAYPCEEVQAVEANRRTIDWAFRCQKRFRESEGVYNYRQFLFPIVQGSTYKSIRRISAERLLELEPPGMAVGGLSVGEPTAIFYEMAEYVAELLPESLPRYLMGTGTPEDLLFAVGAGYDMFDCVLPTRNGRNGQFFTYSGKINIRNAEYKEDFRPVDEDCGCYACQNFSRSYLRHLFVAEEILGLRVASIHNLFFYQELMSRARQHILAGDFYQWRNEFIENYTKNVNN